MKYIPYYPSPSLTITHALPLSPPPRKNMCSWFFFLLHVHIHVTNISLYVDVLGASFRKIYSNCERKCVFHKTCP